MTISWTLTNKISKEKNDVQNHRLWLLPEHHGKQNIAGQLHCPVPESVHMEGKTLPAAWLPATSYQWIKYCFLIEII